MLSGGFLGAQLRDKLLRPYIKQTSADASLVTAAPATLLKPPEDCLKTASIEQDMAAAEQNLEERGGFDTIVAGPQGSATRALSLEGLALPGSSVHSLTGHKHTGDQLRHQAG